MNAEHASCAFRCPPPVRSNNTANVLPKKGHRKREILMLLVCMTQGPSSATSPSAVKCTSNMTPTVKRKASRTPRSSSGKKKRGHRALRRSTESVSDVECHAHLLALLSAGSRNPTMVLERHLDWCHAHSVGPVHTNRNHVGHTLKKFRTLKRDASGSLVNWGNLRT